MATNLNILLCASQYVFLASFVRVHFKSPSLANEPRNAHFDAHKRTFKMLVYEMHMYTPMIILDVFEICPG